MVTDDYSSSANAIAELVRSKVKGVVFFGVRSVALRLLQRAQDQDETGDIQWIFTDSLGPGIFLA